MVSICNSKRRTIGYLFIISVAFIVVNIILILKVMSPHIQIGWQLNVPRDPKIYVLPENDTTLIGGKKLCEAGDLDLLIIIHSAPGNFAQRTAIRETWGSHNISSVKTAFMLGLPKNISLQLAVERENLGYQDIIQEDFIDSYYNLTVKSVMMLKWFLNKCRSPNFLMKTDDDSFINVTSLHSLLPKMGTTQVLIGSLYPRSKPIDDVYNKWYCPPYMYEKPYYPPYLSGSAYLMSRDVAQQLYNVALSTKILHLEDVYITGICAAKAGIEPRQHPGFTHQHWAIECYPHMITNHGLTPSQLRQAWSHGHYCSLLKKIINYFFLI